MNCKNCKAHKNATTDDDPYPSICEKCIWDSAPYYDGGYGEGIENTKRRKKNKKNTVSSSRTVHAGKILKGENNETN